MKPAKQQVAQQFSRAAQTYDEVAQLQFAMAERLIDRIPETATGRLVDFGCGTGYALQLLSRFPDLELTGIDLAEGMIERCRNRLAGVSKEIELKVGDLEQSQLSADSADFAFSSAAIQWCDSQAAFAEFSRVLRSGGTLLASTFGPRTLSQWKDAWSAIGDENQRVHDFESADSLTDSLRAAGFVDIEVVTEMRPATFDSVDAMLHSIKKLGATNASKSRPTGLLGRETYRRLVQHFANQLESDGQLLNDFECIFIRARLED